jgi:hypothetical protein
VTARRLSWRTWLVAATLLSGFVVQCLTGLVRTSATVDEEVYVAAGWTYLETGDFRLKRDAPPLVATLAGGALRLARAAGLPIVLPLASPEWERSARREPGAEYMFARAFFEAEGNDGRRMLQVARLPVVAVGVLLGVVLFRWSAQLFGTAGGLLALLLFCADPNMVAHAQVVSTDVGLAAFFFASHYCLFRLLAGGSPWAVAPLAASVAATLATKYTGLLVLPSLALVTAACLLRPPRAFLAAEGAGVSAYRRRLLRGALLAAAATTAATAALMMALYRRADPWAPYVDGVGLLYENLSPGYHYYLLGRFRDGTWPHYYLVATLLKTPEATLVLLVLALVPWRSRRPGWPVVLFAVVPVVLVYAVCAFDRAQFGLRRVLLVYPFLYLLIGRLPAAWRRPAQSGARAGQASWPVVVLGTLAAASVVTAWRIHPHQLSYFNALCGGPAGGWACLDDSNIDWGQDLPALRDHLRARGIGRVRYYSYAIERPARHGIEAEPVTGEELAEPRREVYVIGVHNLVRMRHFADVTGDPRLDWLARFRPSARIGYSMHVYDLRDGAPG